MMSFFSSAAVASPARQPVGTPNVRLAGAEIAARYLQARLGGDFYDFARAGQRMVFTLLDIAGDRQSGMHLAAAVQDTFRRRVPELFGTDPVNESDAITSLALDINHTLLMTADSVRCTLGFVGSYHETLGTVWYINAGNAPALLKDRDGITELPSTGLPMGLFTHTLHDARACHLEPGAVLVAGSRGLVQTNRGHEDFGLDRLKLALRRASGSAEAISAGLIDAARTFRDEARVGLFKRLACHLNGHGDVDANENDMTALTLVRHK